MSMACSHAILVCVVPDKIYVASAAAHTGSVLSSSECLCSLTASPLQIQRQILRKQQTHSGNVTVILYRNLFFYQQMFTDECSSVVAGAGLHGARAV